MGNIKSNLKSSESEEFESATHSRSIDTQIRVEKKRMKKEVKLLLLGAGESGKSTVLKQMRLIHASGFKKHEREGFRQVVFINVFNAMQTLLEATDMLGLTFNDPIDQDYMRYFLEVPALEENEPFPLDYLIPLKALWEHENVQKALEKGNTLALHDNITYFFDRMDALWQPDYLPTDQDIIRCRTKTIGIVETTFHLGPLIYRMFDVGGQKSERKKWIHCFENVTAILFVAAISGYDQCLAEDRDSNQMHEALMLFDTTCNSHWFKTTSLILLLNKIDIFEKKLHYSPISDYFPDYKAERNNHLESAKSYFKNRFQRLNHNRHKRVYVHFTDATDTKLLQNVMMAVSDIILSENLKEVIM
ncbi:guanine nucleotide binding protein, alpha [Backusella circina FSU 941]|nr:guanine nucleotide binding protein, alpha [Backusella circina FSU 941]